MEPRLATKKAIKKVQQFTTVDIADLIIDYKTNFEITSIDWIESIDTSTLGPKEYYIRVIYKDGTRRILNGVVEVIAGRAKSFDYEPYVARPTRPVNEIKDYHDYNRKQDVPLYHTFIADGPLKLMITVIHNDIFEENNNLREYQVVSFDGLFLDSGNSRYQIKTDRNLSVNPEITQAMFSHILDKYSIVLEKVIMHDYTNYEVPKFHFSDPQKQGELEDIVNKKFSR